MKMEWILGRRDCEKSVLTNMIFYHLEDLLVLVSPMNWRKVSSEIVEGLAVHMKIVDITMLKTKTSQNFHNKTFTLG